MGIRKILVEKAVAVIHSDVGEALPDLLQSLAEAKAEIGRLSTPDQILVRQVWEVPSLE